MSLRPLASLAIKMLGLYAVVNSLPTISTTLFSLFYGPSFSFATSLSPVTLASLNASGGVLQSLVGIALWWFSDGIAQSAVPDDGDAPVRQDESLAVIGFSVVGAYLLSSCIVSLSRYVTSLYLATRYNAVFPPETMRIVAQDLVPSLVQGAIGLYLLFAGRGLVRAILCFKQVGRDAETQT